MEQDSSRALFKPAKTQRASEAIYNQIYPKIVSGELQPGDRLPPERELAEMFQRSRPVVREALRMLQQDGLLDISLGSAGGAVVRGVSLKSVEEPLENLVAMGAINLDELLEYRHINDRGCARLAAIHHTEEDAAALRKTLEGAKASLDIPFSFQEYDIAFHTALAAASHNTLAIMINELFSKPHSVGSSSVDLDVVVAATSDLEAFATAEDVTQYVNFIVEKIQAGVEIPEDQHALAAEFRRNREVRRYLVHAVENEFVSTYAQPIYSLKEERFASFEVLSRLTHPELGRIPADEFIEAAESEGLIARLGRCQLASVCRFASKHSAELSACGITSIKINLSPIELMETGFAADAIETMRRWNVDPSLFQFEITETASTRYGKEMEKAIMALCSAGSKLCMDDFGSGFANLDSVLALPFKVLKIDKTLLDNAVEDESAAALYRSVVEMIGKQGLSTVAEGVETAEQDRLIRSLGIDEAQGYFYAKPMPIEDIFATIQGS